MTIERLFVSRWVAAASLLCLLLLVAAGGWFYQAEATSAEEKARQQLAVLAEIKAGQIETGRQRMLADGMLLSGDSQFVATVDTFLQDSRREDAVLNLLQSHMKHGQYAVILVVDTIGTIRLHLGEANVHCLHLHHAITQALADFQPVLIQPQTGATDESALVGVVTPIVRTDQHQEQRLGAVVLLRVTDRFFGALLGLRQESTEAPQTMLVHRDEQGVLLAQDAPMRDTFGLKRLKLQEVAADSLVGLAVANQVGLVRGRNLQGEESLGFIVRIPAMESWLIVAEPVERIFSLWRYRAAVLLFIFAGAVGLISLLWQCSRKAYYKALYGAEARLRRSLEHQAILLQAIGDGVIATDHDGLIELINPMAEQLTGWSSAEALGRALGDVFTVVTIPGQEAPACSSKGKEKEGSPADRLTHLLLLARDGRELTITALTAPFCNDRGKRVGTVLTFQDRSTEYQTRQWVEARLLLRE